MERITSETISSRRMTDAARGALTGLWLAPRVKRAIARRMAAPVAPPFAAEQEHDGWQPIRARRRPLLIIAIEGARNRERGG
jgi:hypothetical protein